MYQSQICVPCLFFFLSRFTMAIITPTIFYVSMNDILIVFFFYRRQIFDLNLLCNNDNYFSYFFIFIMINICYLFIIDKYLAYIYM